MRTFEISFNDEEYELVRACALFESEGEGDRKEAIHKFIKETVLECIKENYDLEQITEKYGDGLEKWKLEEKEEFREKFRKVLFGTFMKES